MLKTFICVLFAAFLLTLLTIQTALCADGSQKEAPKLVVKEMDGTLFDLSALRGKVVVVNFWATWCPPCKAEMPALDAVYTRYHEQGLEMIGLSADRKHDRKEVTKISQTVHYPIALLVNSKDNGFGVPTLLPLTYVIDSQGVIRDQLNPNEKPLTEDALSKLIEALLPYSPAAISNR